MGLTVVSRNQSYEVEIDGCGIFRVNIDGEGIQDVTLEGLKVKLDRATKEKTKKVAIEFWRWYGEKLLKGSIIGVHSGNGNLLVHIGDNKTQEYGSSLNKYLRLNAEEQESYKLLLKKAMDIDQQIAQFEKAHAFNAKEEVKKALRGE